MSLHLTPAITTWMNIASANDDATWSTLALLVARLGVRQVDVRSVMHGPAVVVGRCLRYEMRGGDVWAQVQIDDWPALMAAYPDAPPHAEAFTTVLPDGSVDLAVVVLTSLPRGALGRALADMGKRGKA